jgi:putative hydrolase of the HAD superfamily
MNGIPLKEIEHVLLDLDGTLLDKYFDDYFWHHLVPEKYAEKHDMSFGKARDYLFKTYEHHEGTLKWTDIDFWSRELDLDIPALKEQIRHLIDVHPHVEDFLNEMRRRKKHIALLTNAHSKAVKLKFRETGIGKYFDDVITSAEMGAPKEDRLFWEKAERVLGFDRERALFIDDTEECLRAARDFGIRYVVLKGRASSKEEPKSSNAFVYITDFNELMEG